MMTKDERLAVCRWWFIWNSEGPIPPESGPNPQGLENPKILCYKYIGVLNGRYR